MSEKLPVKTELPQAALQAIAEIIKRGNDVQIQRKGDSILVLEVKKTIKYSPR
ncbi:MAG: hypothetical protein LUJ09_05365 [Firmicutes bacterium]|nr:hypothetical protein [Bacillota bacterium]